MKNHLIKIVYLLVFTCFFFNPVVEAATYMTMTKKLDLSSTAFNDIELKQAMYKAVVLNGWVITEATSNTITAIYKERNIMNLTFNDKTILIKITTTGKSRSNRWIANIEKYLLDEELYLQYQKLIRKEESEP